MEDPAAEDGVGRIGAGRRSGAAGLMAGPGRYPIGRPANDNHRPLGKSLLLWGARILLIAALAWGLLWLIAQ